MHAHHLARASASFSRYFFRLDALHTDRPQLNTGHEGSGPDTQIRNSQTNEPNSLGS